ncbi:hypothetical protein I4U23_004912 [Adineta vaga]|nr:hypothetical protein I4U23_004912 [Adineta vaga]
MVILLATRVQWSQLRKTLLASMCLIICAILLATYSDPNRAIKKIKRLPFDKIFLIRCQSSVNQTDSHYLSYELPKIDGSYGIDEHSDFDDVFEDLYENLILTACCNSVSSSTESLRLETNAITIDTYHPDSVSNEKMRFLWSQILVNVILNLARPSQAEITTEVYSTINKSFEYMNIDHIFDLRYFLTDLHSRLESLYRDQKQLRSAAPVVYRYFNTPSRISFSDISKNVAGFLSFNTFLSSTRSHPDYNVGTENDIAFEIVNLDTDDEPAVPFAYIFAESATNDNREILFSWNSPFRVQSVGKSEKGVSFAVLELITKQKLRETLDEIARPFVGTICHPEKLLAYGRKLENNGGIDRAIMYYKELFKIMLLNNQYRHIKMYEQLDQLNKEWVTLKLTIH